MPELEKNRSPKKIKVTESKLYRDVLDTRPKFESKEEAVTFLQRSLEALAGKIGLSISELLKLAESSPEFKEEYLEAQSLARQISFLKK